MTEEQVPLEALAKAHWLDFVEEVNPKCPHCGTVYSIGDNEAYELYSDDPTHTVECPSCELPFMVTVVVKYSFSTDDQPDYEE